APRYDHRPATRMTIEGTRTAASRDQSIVAKRPTALDTELPAERSALGAGDGPVIIFEVADHYVSLVYHRASALLRVVVPDDELAVKPSAGFRRLLDAAP